MSGVSLVAEPSKETPWRVPIAALVIALAGTLGRIAQIGRPVDSDTAMFVYMGKLVATGGRVGIDLLDNKLPTVGLLMTGLYRALGAHWWCYGVLALLMTTTASVLLARTVARTIAVDRQWIVLAAAAIWLNFCPAIDGLLKLETIEVFFTTVAGCCVLRHLATPDRRWPFIAGIAAGMAMLAKPTGGAVIAAYLVATLADGRRSARDRAIDLCCCAIGVSVPLGIAVIALIHTDMLSALLPAMQQIREYAAGSPFGWADALKPVVVIALLVLPLFVLTVIFRRDRDARSAPRAINVFVIAWLIAELLAAIAQRRMYAYHFLTVGPPAAVSLALLPRRISLRSVIATCAPLLAISLAYFAAMPADDDRFSRVSSQLASLAAPTDGVWLDEYQRVLVDHDWQPGSRLPMLFLLANSDASPARFSRLLIADFQSRQPRWIVWPADPARLIDLYQHHMFAVASSPVRSTAFADAITAIDQYVHGQYAAVQTVDRQVIYERKPLPTMTSIDTGAR